MNELELLTRNSTETEDTRKFEEIFKNGFEIIPSAFGMVMCLAMFYGLDFRVQQRQEIYRPWFLYKDPMRIILIYLTVCVRLFILNNDSDVVFDLNLLDVLLIGASTLFDFLGVFFMTLGARELPFYIISAFNQSIFMFNTAFNILFWKIIPNLQFCGTSALIILSNYFYYSMVSNYKKIQKMQYFKGSIYGILAALSFTGCMQIQYFVSKKSNSDVYFWYGAIFMMIYSLIFSFTVDKKNIPRNIDDVKKFYKKKFVLCVLSSIAGAIFYLSAGNFMVKFSPDLLNFCCLTFPSFNNLIGNTMDFVEKKGILCYNYLNKKDIENPENQENCLENENQENCLENKNSENDMKTLLYSFLTIFLMLFFMLIL